MYAILILFLISNNINAWFIVGFCVLYSFLLKQKPSPDLFILFITCVVSQYMFSLNDKDIYVKNSAVITLFVCLMGTFYFNNLLTIVHFLSLNVIIAYWNKKEVLLTIKF